MIVQEQDAKEQALTPARAAKWSLFVLVAINILNFYDRHVPGALVEPMRREFNLSDTQIGWISTVFTLLYAAVGIPLGRLADASSRKKLLAVGIAIWAALTASAAWAYSYSFLVFSRLGVAVGEATCAPTATSWIGDLYPPERRAKPLALFMLGVPVGGALSFFFSGPIAQHYGWRTAMVTAAVPALLLIPILLLLDEPERGAAERHTSPATGSIWQILSIPTFWWIVFSGALVNFNTYAIGTFLPAFFSRIHHMNVAKAGITTGVVYGIGGLFGGTIAGIWGDHIIRRRANGRMLVAAIAALAAAPLAYYGIHQSFGAIAVAIPLLTLSYGLLNMYYGLVYASIQDIVAPAMRGISMAVYFLVMYLCGASFGPVITGRLSDFLAHRAAAAAGVDKITETFKAMGLQQAMLVIPVLSVALAIVLWAGSKTIGKDIAQQRKSESLAAKL